MVSECPGLVFSHFVQALFVTPTSVSLLDRLKVARADASDWNRFEAMYQPLIRRWIGRIPGLGNEIEDVAQEVLLVLVREIPRFERQRVGSFRAWLRQVTVESGPGLQKEALPAAGGRRGPDRRLPGSVGRFEQLARQAVRPGTRQACLRHFAESAVRSDFNQSTWDAFQQFAVEGRPAADVARELGLTVNAVVKAKARVLNRLREEAGGFLE